MFKLEARSPLSSATPFPPGAEYILPHFVEGTI